MTDDSFDDIDDLHGEINEITDNDTGLYEHYRFVSDKGQGLIRVDKFLATRIVNISRNRIQQAAEVGSILVNDIPVKSNYKVKPNDVVSIVMNRPPRDTEIIPEDIPLDIV